MSAPTLPATVAVLVGPAEAGKRTLARYPADVVLCLDTYRRMIAGDDGDQDDDDAVALLDVVLAARCRRGLLSLVDATRADARMRRHLVNVAGCHGVAAVALVLDPSLDVGRGFYPAARPDPVPGARWGRAVPAPVGVAQHMAIRGPVSGLAAEGFARIIPVGADGLPTRPLVAVERDWRAVWEPATGTLAVVDLEGETIHEAPVPAAGPRLRHLDTALRTLGWAPTRTGWWHPPYHGDGAPDEYDCYIHPAPAPGLVPAPTTAVFGGHRQLQEVGRG